VAVSIQAKAWTYHKGKSKDKGKSNSKDNSKSNSRFFRFATE